MQSYLTKGVWYFWNSTADQLIAKGYRCINRSAFPFGRKFRWSSSFIRKIIKVQHIKSARTEGLFQGYDVTGSKKYTNCAKQILRPMSRRQKHFPVIFLHVLPLPRPAILCNNIFLALLCQPRKICRVL